MLASASGAAVRECVRAAIPFRGQHFRFLSLPSWRVVGLRFSHTARARDGPHPRGAGRASMQRRKRNSALRIATGLQLKRGIVVEG
jgi:hypothetical protein